jgi:murein tripeptide amidase MpaA
MKTRCLILGLTVIAVLSFASGSVFATEAPNNDCSITVVRAWFSDRSQVEAFAAHDEPWEVHHDQGWMLVGADAETLELLFDLGFHVEIDERRTMEICAPAKRLPDQTEGIPGYACYRTVEETFQTAQGLVANHPDLASLIDAGDSWEKVTAGGNPGYDMKVLRLTNANVAGTPPAGFTGKPRLFVTSAIHAREYTTAELMTRFAEYLVSNHGIDADATWLLDEHEIHLMLQTNPDGRKQAETGLSWRKNTNENYCSPTSSSRGADLNRNFEFQWGCCGGSSGDQCSATYRGPATASEPEVQAVQNYARSIFPDQRDPSISAAAPDNATGLYIDIHSYSQLVLWPWGFTGTPTGNGAALQTLGRKLAFFNGYEPDQAIGLYPTDGTTVDFAYGDLGVAAVLFELGTWFFEDCVDFESTILPDNLEALIYAAKVVRTPYLTPAGPEVTGVAATAVVVAPGDPVTIEAVADDGRFNNSNGSEPAQPVAAAELFIDIPPWQTGANALAMTATDGAFDATVEPIQGVVNTTGLANGRHMAYVRAQDANGNWGPVSAVFVWILDPGTAAHITGNVTAADGGSPLTATVATGIFTTQSDPGTGAYDLMLPDGTYDVTASAEGYGSQTATAVAAAPGIATPLDFVLTPYEIVLSDDVETGNLGWTAEGQWAITDEASASPGHSWTDSPGGEYDDYWDFSLTSPMLDFFAVAGVTLEFSHIYDLENGYDYGHVEYSTDGGATWSTAMSFNGTGHLTWESVEIDLGGLDHVADARVRFRIDTDVSITEDGWHIDDIVIRGFDDPPPGLIFYDYFESGDTSTWSTNSP